MTRRLLICDLDGTLLDSAGEVSRRTRTAVRRAQALGHVFCIATARPVRDTRTVARALGSQPIAICGNGSIIFDFSAEKVISYHPLDRTGVDTVLSALRTGFPGVRFGAECGLDLVLEEGFEFPAVLARAARRVALLEATTHRFDFGKLMVQLDGSAHDYHGHVRDLLTGFEVTVSGGGFCEVMAAGVSKAAAAERMARRLGFPRTDTVAFGDMLNDLPLFAWSGTAVAVANAHPTVLASADEVTETNDEDGVARWLERMSAAPTGPGTGPRRSRP